jgi:tRNA G10  N-methylase Trm11
MMMIPGDKGILSNIEQYQLHSRFVGFLICDVAHTPWRKGSGTFDAIVTDRTQ